MLSANTIIKDLQLGNMAKIYTKLIVREDDMSLCGFSTKEELEMFELLTSVSKIGPKVGLGILSFASPRQLGAYIVSEDIAKMSKAPGVGKKTAERIILELKDKIDKKNIEFEATLLSQVTNGSITRRSSRCTYSIRVFSTEKRKKQYTNVKKTGLNTEDIIKKSLSYLMSKALR